VDQTRGGKASGGPGIDPHDVYHLALQEPKEKALSVGSKPNSSVLVEVGSLLEDDDAPTRNGGRVPGVPFNRDSRAESGVLGEGITEDTAEEEGKMQVTPENISAILPSNEASESTEICTGSCSGRKHEATSTILGGTSTPPPADFTHMFVLGHYNTFMARRTKGALELASEVCCR
jgi:hypothetical protein